MSEVFGESTDLYELRPSYEELADLPHETLATYAHSKQEEVVRVRSLLKSVVKIQRDRELALESEIYNLEETVEQDPLTGLLNKKAWITRLEVLIDEEDPNFGVIFIDLSRFKLVNDTFDHIRGDEVLVKTAEVIEQSLRQEGDYVAYDTGRYGGDEFAILCNLDPREEASFNPVDTLEIITERLQQNFNTMIAEEKLEFLQIDAAIGSAVYEKGMTAEDLIRTADKAMYNNKYARTVDLTDEETLRLKAVKHILDKAGVRIPEGILEDD